MALFPLISAITSGAIDSSKDVFNQNSISSNSLMYFSGVLTQNSDSIGTERGFFVVVPGTWVFQFRFSGDVPSAYRFKIYSISGGVLTELRSFDLTHNMNSTLSHTFYSGTTYVCAVTKLSSATIARIQFYNIVKRMPMTHSVQSVTKLEAKTWMTHKSSYLQETATSQIPPLLQKVDDTNPLGNSLLWKYGIPVFARIERGTLPPGITFNPTTLRFSGSFNGDLTNALTDTETGIKYFEAMILLGKFVGLVDTYYYLNNEHVHYSTRWVRFDIMAPSGCSGDFNWDELKQGFINSYNTLQYPIESVTIPELTELEKYQKENPQVCLCEEIEQFLIKINK